VSEIQGGLIRINNDTAFLPENILEQNQSTIARAYPYDIVIAKGGNSIAKVGLLTEEYSNYCTSRDVIILRRTSKTPFNIYYLWSFLHSRYGQELLLRSASQTGQPHLTIEGILELPIPNYSYKLQDRFEKLYNASSAYNSSAFKMYLYAEGLLLGELGGRGFESRPDSGKLVTAVKTLKDSFESSGRIDAEYYQPKYDEIEKDLKQYTGGWDILDNVFDIHDANVNPHDDTIYKYIELADIGNSGEVTGCTETEGIQLPSRARRRVYANQLLVSSIEGSLQSCALVPEEYDNGLCSTGFYVISSDSINPETSLVLFKSKPIQALMKKICSGTILTAMTKDEFKLLPIPKIRKEVQPFIAEKVQESFKLRKQSKALLEAAKKAVEIAIEQNEEEAIRYLKEYM